LPIHDQGYRRYGGERAPHGQAWAVIAKAGVRTFLAKKAFLGLLLFAWVPFIIRSVQIYAAANFPQAAEILAVKAETFRQFLDQQGIFVFFITVYVGAGLIANDRRANALQIYLSKPLSRTEYVLGKLAILMTFLLLVTWVPAIVLLIVQIMFAGNFTFFRNNVFLFPAITLFSFIYVVMVSASMLALSSLSNSSRYVGILFAALIFFTQALYGVLRFVTGNTSLSWVSFTFNLEQVGDAIFRLPPRYDTPWTVSLLMIGLLILASGLILERRVRGVEIVS
jgi:ABC-type transport system involved in multi-copper enzyme maturation permease subunit